MTPTPLLGRHFQSVPRAPSLVGVLDNGDLIDLDDGVIELQVNQSIQYSIDSHQKPRVEDGLHTYILRFTKTVGTDDEWIRWWVANDEWFTVAGIKFRLMSEDNDGRTVTYQTEGRK